MSENPIDKINRPAFIKEEVSLASFNTFRFGYRAQYFALIDRVESLVDAMQWARAADVTVTVIGGGSNLLISGDIAGLVIVNRLSGKKLIKDASTTVCLRVGAGENWHELVAYVVKQGWYGIENLALIPGTVGAAPVQNIGAYGVEVKDVLSRVQVLNVMTDELTWLQAEDCGFAYRNSHFKGKWYGQYIITAVEFGLSKKMSFSLNYGGLSQQVEGHITLEKVFQAVCVVRRSKLPDPKELANAGSFFKNPIVSKECHDRLKALFPNLVSFVVGDNYKLAAGWMIDQAGWKGKIHLGVGVYDKQALVLVNYSESKADAILELERLIKESILNQYGVILEREPVKLPVIDAMSNLQQGGIQ